MACECRSCKWFINFHRQDDRGACLLLPPSQSNNNDCYCDNYCGQFRAGRNGTDGNLIDDDDWSTINELTKLSKDGLAKILKDYSVKGYLSGSFDTYLKEWQESGCCIPREEHDFSLFKSLKSFLAERVIENYEHLENAGK